MVTRFFSTIDENTVIVSERSHRDRSQFCSRSLVGEQSAIAPLQGIPLPKRDAPDASNFCVLCDWAVKIALISSLPQRYSKRTASSKESFSIVSLSSPNADIRVSVFPAQ